VAAHLPSRQPRAKFTVESSPPRASEQGVLYLWFADSSVRSTAVRALRAAHREAELSISCVRVAVPEGEMDRCVLELGAELGRAVRRRR
jgi:hypothetical protein